LGWADLDHRSIKAIHVPQQMRSVGEGLAQKLQHPSHSAFFGKGFPQ
jgi:hypothetical protein